MGSPRLHVAAVATTSPVPLSPAAELIRANLATRCQGLAELEPAALDLAARVLEQLHTACWSRQAELRGTHSPEHRRHQLMGGAGLSVEGLCYLLVRAPEVVRGGLEVMASAAGCALEPLPVSVSSIGRQAAEVSRSGGELTGTVTESLEDDGVVDQVELGAIRERMAAHKRAMAGLEAEVARMQLEPRRRTR